MLMLPVFLPMLFAAAAAVLGAVTKKEEGLPYWTALLGMALQLALAVLLCFLPAKDLKIPVVLSYGLYFTMDGFRRIYMLVIAFMWFMTMLLSKEYFHGHHHLNRYYFFSLMTEGAITGVFLSGDLFTALAFFEVMSFTSFVWVIQEETDGAVRAANTYLAIAVIGGLSALFGIWLLDVKLGTTEISALYGAAEAFGEKRILYIAGACILVGFGAKAGVFPLHIWLPKAHPVAPAPASALLSGVLTKSGIFGVIVISCQLFREDPAWGMLILALGTVTMFLGAVLALLSVDLKRTLACSSMSQIGFILIGIACTCLLGEEGTLPAAGAVLHMVNHSMLKLVLFMCAGAVYMNLHELDLNRIRGFGRGKYVLQACFLLGAVGIGGIPGFNGYISKTLLHEGIVEAAHEYGLIMKAVEWIFLASGGLTLGYMTKLYICIFHEKPGADAAVFQEKMRAHKPSYLGIFGHIALIGSAVFMPLFGLSGNTLMRTIAGEASGFFRAEPLHRLSFFSLENLKGAGISILIGTAVYLLVVRKLLMKNGSYINVLPAKADLEDSVYRPLLLKILPSILGPAAAVFGENKVLTPVCRAVMRAGQWTASLFGENKILTPACRGSMRALSGFFTTFGENKVLSPVSRAAVRITGVLSRAASDTVDAVILLLRRTVLKSVLPPPSGEAEQSAAYRFGNAVDRVYIRKGKEKRGEHRFAEYFYRLRMTLVRSTHQMWDSMSFALLMMILAVTAVLLYVLFVHHFE